MTDNQKCSMCGCIKLLTLYHIRKNTGKYYKTCIQCCKRFNCSFDCCVESIDNDGITCDGTHHRMKGISERGLRNHAEIHYKGDMFKLYENLAKDNNENIILNY